jgi:hypothetical protein
MSTLLTPHSSPKMARTDITLEEYNGADLLNLVVVRDSTGKHRLNGMRRTARHVSFNARLIPQLIAALKDAKHKAVELGVLPHDEEH